jgi:beta-lactam-binding protein with PASTA domain/formylglycine-generating enzyme required for sulfatase activity
VGPALNFSEGDVFGTTTFAPATTVPEVVGLQETPAKDAIGAAFLLVGNTTRAPSNTVNFGDVISSDPAGDTDVIQFSSVDLVVSDGPSIVVVPDVVGEFEGDAINAVEGAFLVSSSSYQADDIVEIGRVISQDPIAGTEVDPGSIVQLVVSAGSLVTVPDVVEETQEDAEADILAAGLVPDVTLQADDIVPAGLVISQDPPGGAAVNEGTTVDLFVSQPVTLGFVTVGDPGNAADPATTFGAVAATYMIGETEVTNAQYAEFLNAKAVSGDPLGLYDPNMAGSINRSGTIQLSTYSVVAGRENKPVFRVDFYDTLRFANWLNNGGGSGDTETGSYTLEGGTEIPSNGPTVTRNASARIALTSEDEWYKAAYYDAASMSYNPYPFADGFDGAACEVPAGTTSHSANCFGADVDGSDVAAYTTSPSDYGTFDQGGNAAEWNEAIIDSERVARGGNWGSAADTLAATFWVGHDPIFADGFTGFRVVSIPEPDQAILLLAALITLALLRWKASSRGSMPAPGFAGRT